MRLAFQIPDKIWWIHNFLTHDQYKRIHNTVHKERKKLRYQSSFGVWQDDLSDNLKPIDRVTVDPLFFNFYQTLLHHNPIMPIPMGKATFVVHNMKKGSGINWHDDGHCFYGVTYYLNRRWSSQWGGEFMFRDKTQCGYLPVVGNSLVIVKSPFEHKVNPILSPIVPRVSIQSFIGVKKK
tara:strand:- start:457 stop:996 length:540 start_codon:yes stop_codon:yes gene_type:complete